MRSVWVALTISCLACGSRSGLRDLPGDEAEAGPPGPIDCYGAGETMLAEGEPSATALALDSDRVYWASPGSDCEHGQIRSVPKAGGSITTLAADEPNPRALAVDDARVYYYDGCGTGLLRSVPKSGGSVVDLPIVIKPEDPRVLTVHAGFVYFNAYGMLRIPTSGGTQSVVDETVFAVALAADAAGIYWSGPAIANNSDVIVGLDSGDDPHVVAHVGDVRWGLALDSTYIYFNSGDFIRRVPRAGGDVTTITVANAWKLAVDDTHVYWTEGVLGSDCAVKKAPKAGGEATLLASCTGAYLDIAVDDRCVYWTNLYGSNVMRAPK